MKRFSLAVFLVFALIGEMVSQVADTIELKEIVVAHDKTKYLVGAKVENVDLLEEKLVNTNNLSQLLGSMSHIHIKSQANNFSTISFRGTSADHTAILFNGENVNSITLGHSNLSLLPTYFMDNMQIVYGGASSVYGSDAIGGTINLTTKPTWEKGVSAEVKGELGSFHNYFTGTKFRVGNGKIESATKFYYDWGENDFPFWNIEAPDFEKQEFPRLRHPHNAYDKKGISQEVYYKFNKKNTFSVNYWHTDIWYQSQMKMSSVGGDAKPDVSSQQTHYGIVDHEFENKRLSIHSKLVWIRYDMLYNRTDDFATRRLIGETNLEYDFVFPGTINFGIKNSYLKADVHAYEDIIYENRSDAFVYYIHDFGKGWKASLNYRASYSEKYNLESSPSIGVNKLFTLSDHVSLIGKASISRSYKIPTFNDRYWIGAGKENLKTEKGYNADFSCKVSINGSNHKFIIEANPYYMIIDDWIQWFQITQDKWAPENLKVVESKGLEYNMIYEMKNLPSFRLKSKLCLAFNSSKMISSYDSSLATTGEQLAYSPKLTGKYILEIERKTILFGTDISYTGERNVAENEDAEKMADYYLVNASIGKNFRLKSSEFQVLLRLENILNKRYYNMLHYAMPEFGWSIGITYNF